MKKTVPYITGDGVGAEITPAMQAIVNADVYKRQVVCVQVTEFVKSYRAFIVAVFVGTFRARCV